MNTMNNVHHHLLYVFYIKPSTVDNASVELIPLTDCAVKASLDQMVQELVDLAEERARERGYDTLEGRRIIGGSVYCPRGPGVPFLEKVYADLKQQPLEDYAEQFHLNFTIQESLCPDEQDKPPRKPLLIVFRLSPIPQGLKRQRAPSLDDDVVMPLTKNFRGHKTKGKMPSSDYAENQSSPDVALLDGRFVSRSPVETTAPPIELYHRAFAQFTALARDPAFQLPDDDDILSNTAALIRSCSEIETYKGLRNSNIREILGRILGLSFDVLNDDVSAAGYIAPCKTSSEFVTAALVIAEIEGELGSTDTDPSVQASFSFTRFYCQPQRDPITDQCNCPTFIVGIAGPWLVIMGAVLTIRPVIQRLSDYMWLGNSRVLDENQVKRVARNLYALRMATKTLAKYWESFVRPRRVKGCEHPRFSPSFDSFIDVHTLENVKFAYVKPLEEAPSCVTFLAKKLPAEGSAPDKDNGNGPIVIKFVRRYNQDAHLMMGERGFAPKLLGYRPLREEDPGYDDLALLATEYVEGETLFDLYRGGVLPKRVKQGVEEALQVLNGAGYIFADLRRPNLIVRERDGKVQLIDFDWVCRAGEGMRYPFHLSRDVRTRSGAKDNDVITLEHQERMFEKL
ncbi:hypothetical protein E1B28_000084 [Marasmius oreades]|uniref:Protein kinase domain-containing protein n=1 Tax=Marasmius oreades TaxID=181124 RepID=A0A9P8AE42_9AGAR|nr:uncharacterized protein E1B28_000084 [Marasmius oreades]KAG7098113.1 hypothetical protein E1B28_000084 [Marasmius oreades]